MWQEWLSKAGAELEPRPGCAPAEIQSGEAKLGVTLPHSLVRFLHVSNGFFHVEAQLEYAWRLERIVAENRRAWSSSPGLDDRFLGFGSDGAGDWFCLSLRELESPVYHWAWIPAELRIISPDLATFWPGWVNGSISV